jgi:hypothetical protein
LNEHNSAERIMSALKHHAVLSDAKVQRQGCLLLGCLADRSSNNQMVLRQAGSIAAIIGARKSQCLSISLSDISDADAMRMHESEAEVQQWGCWALIVSEKIRNREIHTADSLHSRTCLLTFARLKSRLLEMGVLRKLHKR